MSKKLSAKQRMINALQKTTGYNTFTVSQARSRFGVSNVAARIDELRNEGHCIYTNQKTLSDGRKISFYRLGTPRKSMLRAAMRAGYSLA
jgi:hypothetical protein